MRQKMNWTEFAGKYCERQVSTPDDLLSQLHNVAGRFSAVGFMLLECADMCSSRMGELTILPYGGNSTYPAVPNHPISPRGLASDMSTVIGTIAVSDLPPLGE